MDWTNYLELFDKILNREIADEPYDDEHFYEYTKLNKSRMNRWLKTGVLDAALSDRIKSITTPMKWILITEPWCGDASHSTPFIYMLSALNPLIDLEIQLRDSGSEIENYLTNGGKSIPILIIRDSNNKDIAVWGPRPKACQEVFLQNKDSGMELEEQKVHLQEWYNQNKGMDLQKELLSLL